MPRWPLRSGDDGAHDHGWGSGGTRGEVGGGLSRRLDEALVTQDVPGRVAGHRHLGQHHELGAGSLGDRTQAAVDVALEVADGGVDLRETDPHGCDCPRRRGSGARGAYPARRWARVPTRTR